MFQLSTAAKVLPFATFIALMILESALKSLAPDLYEKVKVLLYPLRVLITSFVLVWLWIVLKRHQPSLKGMSLDSLSLAVAAGTVVIVFWIFVGPLFRVGTPSGVNPIPEDQNLALFWLGSRFLGAVILVPIIEELFWRSFLARRIDEVDVDRLAPQSIAWKAVFVSSVAFGLAHSEVLAGVVAGIVFCWLYKRRGDIREAIVAHAVANALLFAYVIKFSAFEFWG
jgi:uncharacterized protein